MSYTELRTGKVRPVSFPTDVKTDKEKIAYLQDVLGFTFTDIDFNDDGTLWDAYSEDIVYLQRGQFWELIEDEEHEGDAIEITGPNEDGTYNYLLQWYNGGAAFEEVLEWALKKNDLL